jgi:hypothetical protein
MELEIKDIIKFDKKDSIMSWFGEVIKICDKSVVVRYAAADDFNCVERVKKNMILGVM